MREEREGDTLIWSIEDIWRAGRKGQESEVLGLSSNLFKRTNTAGPGGTHKRRHFRHM